MLTPNNLFDQLELEVFLNSNKEGTKSFRYYNTRSFDVIKNHKVTKLYYDKSNNSVGYGHLDFDKRLWLGIIIGDNYKGMGYGSFIMDDLLDNQEEDIYLTVDKDNVSAIKLYKKKKFNIIEETNNHYLMIKKK